jgi:hypothetical protein
MATLDSIKKDKDNSVKKFLEASQKKPEVRGLNLTDYLIKPSKQSISNVKIPKEMQLKKRFLFLSFILVQRVCKYPLLLRELLNWTSKEDI